MQDDDMNLPQMASPNGRDGVVFIEANPFASRLHVLGPMAAGAASPDRDVWIVGPERPPGTDFAVFTEGLYAGVSFVSIAADSAETGKTSITPSLLIRLLKEARRILLRCERRTLVLSAIDDYFSALPWISVVVRIFFPRTRIIVVRYRVADLLPIEDIKPVQLVKRVVISMLEMLTGAESAIFDERVAESTKLHVLPDPWTGPFGATSRAESRLALGWSHNSDVILLVGGQDERKGFNVAVPALVLLRARRPNLRVALVGRVDPSMRRYLQEIVGTFGQDFLHISDYLSDEDMARYFAAASAVLLPYHTDFTSTSGVLVRAAASSTPVVSSNHGLVGWRTRHHSLGETFGYPDHTELASKIAAVLEKPFSSMQALIFAQGSTEMMLSEAFESILND
ncbi:glycosyltransferase family 4 protein [Pseudarthrobacter sp. H2]|uniref:glycosyltransferase family 4 protein n=1 Tax=Pseudarthrobacter sp. H2 TaxID=3418415 RepID=UPI003CF70E60